MIKYVCPVHHEVILFEESEPPDQTTTVVKKFVSTVTSILGGAVVIIPSQDGPFLCSKCEAAGNTRSYYYKEECIVI